MHAVTWWLATDYGAFMGALGTMKMGQSPENATMKETALKRQARAAAGKLSKYSLAYKLKGPPLRSRPTCQGNQGEPLSILPAGPPAGGQYRS